MQQIWKKLNLKHQKKIAVLNAPASFEPQLVELNDVVISRLADSNISFLLVFVTRRDEIALIVRTVIRKTMGDPVVWFAYPKGSSKRLDCDFNRDNGWESLAEAGFKGVRQVAIDEDWSALRFRRVEFVKTKKG